MFLKHKFSAQRSEHDGIKFQSKKEGAYYQKLKLLQKSGEVLGFFRQVPIFLPGNVRYVMDFFVFYSDGTCEGIEVKGFETETWKAKKRMVNSLYPWLPLRVVK